MASRFQLPELPQATLMKIGAYLLTFVVIAGVFFFWLSSVKRQAVENHKIQVEAQASAAREEAADERVRDAIRDTENAKDLHNAIDTAPATEGGNRVSDAHRALNCERLRKLGRVPTDCRPSYFGGAEAVTRR